jgi:hypothetical protein
MSGYRFADDSIAAPETFLPMLVYRPAANSAALSSDTGIVTHDPSKLYVSNGNMRLETHGLIGTILLVNREEESAYAVFRSKKEYEPLARGLSEYFPVKDVENACPDWQKAAGQEISCEKVGHGPTSKIGEQQGIFEVMTVAAVFGHV